MQRARQLPPTSPVGAAPLRLLPEPTLRDLDGQPAIDGPALRTATVAWLRAVADRLAALLPPALSTAERAWDQADRLRLLDAALRRERARLDTLLAGSSDRGVATVCGMAISAAMGWIDLFERRMATLLRLRLREGAPLLVDGRPFLDVEPVLRELARHLDVAGGAP